MRGGTVARRRRRRAPPPPGRDRAHAWFEAPPPRPPYVLRVCCPPSPPHSIIRLEGRVIRLEATPRIRVGGSYARSALGLRARGVREGLTGERVALTGRLLLVLLGVCEYSAGLGVMVGEFVWQLPEGAAPPWPGWPLQRGLGMTEGLGVRVDETGGVREAVGVREGVRV